MSKGEKPIGYWLKEADKSISAKVDKNLEQYNLTRLHWQVLNTVYEKDIMTREAIFDLLRNFVDEPYLSEILNEFSSRNWMNQVKSSEPDTTLIQMTEEGKVAFTEIFSTQQKNKNAIVSGYYKRGI